MQLKRYQHPAVVEHLAMTYVLGTLRGRARRRFEQLQERYVYLRMVTQTYQQQLAGLVEVLPPEQPSPEVWKRLACELQLETM